MVYRKVIQFDQKDRFQDGLANEVKELTWLHYENPDKWEVRQVLEDYHLPVHFGEYVYDLFETSWIEYYRNDAGDLFTYIIIQYPYGHEVISENTYHTAPLVIVMGQDLVMTFMNHTNLPFMLDIQRLNFPSDFPMTSAYAFVMYMFYEVAQAHIDAVTIMHGLIKQAEEEARHSTKNNVSYALININKGLVYLSTAVHNNAKTLSRINQYINQLENDTRYHERVLNRVQIEMNQAVTMIENDMAVIDKLNDMLSNVISNNLNDVMKRLTVITIIMTVPTITAGLWGMNVALPLEDNVHGFSIILVGSIILSVIIYFIIDRMNLFK
ncbi:magnesium transporter CorA family protein [Aerococcus viridans]|uniref:magnesium transporter CorA family protein n=1 Tax=Aerococcus viridans TaxID=1377 RepID=UPI00223BD478|nr:magnesium transporter CorA family protein [Aerococcus viridans]MCT1797947.1 magnesium transporter CorA family protein [Aerococcus viridans]